MTDRQVNARRRIAATAAAIIGGTLSYIEGARLISSIRFSAGMEDDPDIMPFVAIDSETDALPFGSVRELWKPSALDALQTEIEKAEAWAEETGREHCQSLISRLGSLL